MKAASLCTGYGGLDLAAGMVLDTELAWYAEVDPDASMILDHRYPDVPNHGDITAIDWTAVDPVDLLTAGYPCQPMSYAGRRAGLSDERWLWDDGVFPAIRDLRPGIVLLENVPGHLSMGFGRVLGDLAAIGYDASWMCVRASDVGAPHRRERVFIVAEDTDRATGGHRRFAAPGQAPGGRAWPDARGSGGASAAGGVTLLPTPTARDHKGQNQRRDDSCLTGALLPTPRATDGTKGGPNQRGSSGDLMLPSAVQLLPTPTVNDSRGGRNATAGRTNADSAHHDGWTLSDVAYAGRLGDGALLPTPMSADGGADRGSTAGNGLRNTSRDIARSGMWGEYGPAIRRWEHVTGRTAPEPTEPGQKGGRRLSPRFVEWLMGLPDGWVTDIPGLKRNAQLKALGNGVVPQQGAHAFRLLLDQRSEVAA